LAPGTGYQKTRDQIRGSLVQAGVDVLPEKELVIEVLTPDGFQSALEISRAFVQVLGTDPHPSEAWDGCAVAGQYRRAREANKPYVTYCKPGLIGLLDDDDYRSFVQSVLEDAKETQEEVIRTVLEALRVQESPARLKRSAYMHCPRGAREMFLATKRTIEEAIVCKIRPSKHLDDNPNLNRILSDETERLQIYNHVDGVLFLNITPAPNDWLRRQLDILEDDRDRFERRGTLRGLVLDRAGNAGVVTALYDDVEVISWPDPPDPGPILPWLCGGR
jgi:hypothetical protein